MTDRIIEAIPAEGCTSGFRAPVVTSNTDPDKIGKDPQGEIPVCTIAIYLIRMRQRFPHLRVNTHIEGSVGKESKKVDGVVCNHNNCLNHRDYSGPASRTI